MIPSHLTLATVLGCGLATAAPALTLDYTVVVGNGALAGQSGFGTLSFDETLLTGSGTETLSQQNDPTLTITLGILGLFFSEMNDFGFPDFPSFDFVDGVLDGIDFILEDGANGVQLTQFNVFDIFIGDAVFDQQGALSFVADLQYYPAEVPLPGSLALMLGALGVGAAMRRKTV